MLNTQKMNYSPINNVNKIAVLRAGALGDFIVALPALKAIRLAYPEAELVLLGRPWQEKFLVENRAYIDRVIVIPARKGIRDENFEDDNATLHSFYKKMQAENFDIAVNMQGNGISANSFINALNAKCTAGLTSKNAATLNRSIDFYYYQSETIRYIEVAKLLGITCFDLEPEIKILKQDEDEVAPIIHELKKPFIVLHPFAMDVRRMWPLKNYSVLAEKLKLENFDIVFSGSSEDRKDTDSIIRATNCEAHNVCGGLSLGGLTGLLSKAALVIGADTGPLHLARAVQTPTVSMHWAPNLINWGPVTRSIHHPVVSWQMQCPLCGETPNDPYPFEPKTNCDHAVSFVKNITVEQVMEAARSLLQRIPVNNKSMMWSNDTIFQSTKYNP
jgi:ADP-heptose:LPS heptosyltransferase